MSKIKSLEGIDISVTILSKREIYIGNKSLGIMRKLRLGDLKNGHTPLYYPNGGYIRASTPEEYIKVRNHRKYKDGDTAFDIWYRTIIKLNKGVYKDTLISEDWKCFNNFIPFYDKYYIPGYVIDKDILSYPNPPIYSFETCAFIPPKLNVMVREFSIPKTRGYSISKDKYIFYRNNNTISKPYDYFYTDNPEEAFKLYALARCIKMIDFISLYEKNIRPEAIKALYKFYNYNNYVERANKNTL